MTTHGLRMAIRALLDDTSTHVYGEISDEWGVPVDAIRAAMSQPELDVERLDRAMRAALPEWQHYPDALRLEDVQAIAAEYARLDPDKA